MTYLIPILFITTACKKTPQIQSTVDPNAGGQQLAPGEAETREAIEQLVENFERVHFAVDTSSLDAQAIEALSANAAILQSFPRLAVEIQGHADERGTVDYNLSLGQRRARAVVEFLSAQGVDARRLHVISYGEERPSQAGSGEIAWAANRRAEFRILSGSSDRVVGTTLH